MKRSRKLHSDSARVRAALSGLDRLAICLIAFAVLFLVLAVSKLFLPRENSQSGRAPGAPLTDFRFEIPGVAYIRSPLRNSWRRYRAHSSETGNGQISSNWPRSRPLRGLRLGSRVASSPCTFSLPSALFAIGLPRKDQRKKLLCRAAPRAT